MQIGRAVAAFAAVILMGAGCAGAGGGSVDVDEQPLARGAWQVLFDLPENWVMVAPYDVDDNVPPAMTDWDANEVVIQSTGKLILRTSGGTEENTEKDPSMVEQGDAVKITVRRIDPRRVVPSEAEDLGNGLRRVVDCDPAVAESPCTSLQSTYYFTVSENRYEAKSMIYGTTWSAADIEQILASAQPTAEPETVVEGAAETE